MGQGRGSLVKKYDRHFRPMCLLVVEILRWRLKTAGTPSGAAP